MYYCDGCHIEWNKSVSGTPGHRKTYTTQVKWLGWGVKCECKKESEVEIVMNVNKLDSWSFTIMLLSIIMGR